MISSKIKLCVGRMFVAPPARRTLAQREGVPVWNHDTRGRKLALVAATAGAVAALAFLPAWAQPPQPQTPAVHGPWMDKSLSPDKRADLVDRKSTRLNSSHL